VTQENVETVRAIFAEWEQGRMQAGVDRFDPEIVFESFMPDSRERAVATGAEEVATFMRELLAQWSHYRILGDEFESRAGGDVVLVAGHQAGVGRQSEVSVQMPIFSVWRFRDGRIVKLDWFSTRAQAEEEAGGP
jgi:ketosteroid isomerase-like protein